MSNRKDKSQEIYGVCPACGKSDFERVIQKDAFGKIPEEPNRKSCFECGEVWAGLYRSALKSKR